MTGTTTRPPNGVGQACDTDEAADRDRRHRGGVLNVCLDLLRRSSRRLPTMANPSPTAASYLRRPGDSDFPAFKLDVLCVGAASL